MTMHIVKSYEEELAGLDTQIAQMGGQVERLVADAIYALENRAPELAETTVHSDASIDILERQIEEQVVGMIARRQPMAMDLRQIMTVFRVSSDLERIGDLGKNIAKRAYAVAGENHPQGLVRGLRHMGDLALEQLKNVLDAYSQRDAEKAVQVWQRDEDIDAMYNSLFREFLTYMMEDPRNISLCTHMLFGAKNIERIGDHATNIAESVYFFVHGKELPNERPKSDFTSSAVFKKDE
ncbi:MAG: phosphate signaling complex protein PhoU [Pseudomonadota bacterium]